MYWLCRISVLATKEAKIPTLEEPSESECSFTFLLENKIRLYNTNQQANKYKFPSYLAADTLQHICSIKKNKKKNTKLRNIAKE